MKAFPTHTITVSDEARITAIGGQDGMDLRDYFAAKVMQARIFEGPIAQEFYRDMIAKHSYEMADAMMKARKA
jgi:hypothetical protein